MDFQQFKIDIEGKLKDKVDFDLQEFRYLPYAFGNGLLAYRIKGYIFRFTHDGRDNLLTCERSNSHEKYPHCNWTILFENSGLALDQKQIDVFLNF
ncbi:MAG: hypothetical protein ABI203_10965 [Mucilaginibacter sp.]